MKYAALGVCVAVAAWGATAADASTLYASINDGPGPVVSERMFTIDQTFGAASLLGDSGFSSPLDLASDWRAGSFRLWACNSNATAGLNQLITIDPLNGMGTLVDVFGTTSPIRSLAFDVVSGKLFGTTFLDQLYEINPDTAASTLIGTVIVGSGGILGLGFDLAGTLYGVTEDNLLITIKTDTAVASVIGPLGVSNVNDVAVRPEDGVMFGVSAATDSIYAVDSDTGSTILMGPHGQGIDFMVGLAFGVVPEPATMVLLVVGSLGLMRRRRDA